MRKSTEAYLDRVRRGICVRPHCGRAAAVSRYGRTVLCAEHRAEHRAVAPKVFNGPRDKGRRWSQIDADLRAGMRSRDAAAKWGMQATHVSKRRKKLGLPPLPPGRRPGEGDKAPRSAVTDVIIERARMGRSDTEASIEVGVSVGTVGHAATRWVRGIVGRAGRGPVARSGKEKRGTRLTATWNGETLTLAAWSERTGLKVDTIAYRLRAGWPVERALTAAPVGSHAGVAA